MFGDDLNQAQIAQLVTDITNSADIDKNGNIGKTRVAFIAVWCRG